VQKNSHKNDDETETSKKFQSAAHT